MVPYKRTNKTINEKYVLWPNSNMAEVILEDKICKEG